MASSARTCFWAFAYNVAAHPGRDGRPRPASGSRSSPALAAGAMAMSSVAVVTNSLRLRGSTRDVRGRRQPGRSSGPSGAAVPRRAPHRVAATAGRAVGRPGVDAGRRRRHGDGPGRPGDRPRRCGDARVAGRPIATTGWRGLANVRRRGRRPDVRSGRATRLTSSPARSSQRDERGRRSSFHDWSVEGAGANVRTSPARPGQTDAAMPLRCDRSAAARTAIVCSVARPRRAAGHRPARCVVEPLAARARAVGLSSGGGRSRPRSGRRTRSR